MHVIKESMEMYLLCVSLRSIDVRDYFIFFKNQEKIGISYILACTGEGADVVVGSTTPATHFHICYGNCACHILCHYIASWRGKGNTVSDNLFF